MPLPPTRDHKISAPDAAAMTRRYREQAEPGAQLGLLFHRDIIDRILAQGGCKAIRIYEARDERGKPQSVIVGVDGDGSDMTTGLLAESGIRCPPYCGGGEDGQGLAG